MDNAFKSSIDMHFLNIFTKSTSWQIFRYLFVVSCHKVIAIINCVC